MSVGEDVIKNICFSHKGNKKDMCEMEIKRERKSVSSTNWMLYLILYCAQFFLHTLNQQRTTLTAAWRVSEKLMDHHLGIVMKILSNND